MSAATIEYERVREQYFQANLLLQKTGEGHASVQKLLAELSALKLAVEAEGRETAQEAARPEAIETTDRKTNMALARYIKASDELAAALATLQTKYEAALKVWWQVDTEFGTNPRLNQNTRYEAQPKPLIGFEMRRLAMSGAVLPGATIQSEFNGIQEKSSWPSLGDRVRQWARTVWKT